jgi:hypothetical protein
MIMLRLPLTSASLFMGIGAFFMANHGTMVVANPLCPPATCDFKPDLEADIVGFLPNNDVPPKPVLTVPGTFSTTLVGISGGNSPGETVGTLESVLSGTALTFTVTSATDYCLDGGKYFLSNSNNCTSAYLDANGKFLDAEMSSGLYSDFVPTTGTDGFCLDKASETVTLTSIFPAFKAGDPICVLFYASGIKRGTDVVTSSSNGKGDVTPSSKGKGGVTPGDVCVLVDGYTSDDVLLSCSTTARKSTKAPSNKQGRRNRGRRVVEANNVDFSDAPQKNTWTRNKGVRSSGNVEQTFVEAVVGDVRGLQEVEDCPAYFVLQEKTVVAAFKGAGVRFRDFDATASSQRLFVGSGDLGNSTCRASDAGALYDHNGAAMTVTLTYWADTDALTGEIESAACTTAQNPCSRTTLDLDNYRGLGRPNCYSPDASDWNAIKLQWSPRGSGNPSGVVTNMKLIKSNGAQVDLGNNFCLTNEVRDMYWYLGDIGNEFLTGTTKIEATVILCNDSTAYGNNEGSKIQIQFGTLIP